MAIDTANKRLSAFNAGALYLLPFPSGSLTFGDRATVQGIYAHDSLAAVRTIKAKFVIQARKTFFTLSERKTFFQ